MRIEQCLLNCLFPEAAATAASTGGDGFEGILADLIAKGVTAAGEKVSPAVSSPMATGLSARRRLTLETGGGDSPDPTATLNNLSSALPVALPTGVFPTTPEVQPLPANGENNSLAGKTFSPETAEGDTSASALTGALSSTAWHLPLRKNNDGRPWMNPTPVPIGEPDDVWNQTPLAEPDTTSQARIFTSEQSPWQQLLQSKSHKSEVIRDWLGGAGGLGGTSQAAASASMGAAAGATEATAVPIVEAAAETASPFPEFPVPAEVYGPAASPGSLRLAPSKSQPGAILLENQAAPAVEGGSGAAAGIFARPTETAAVTGMTPDSGAPGRANADPGPWSGTFLNPAASVANDIADGAAPSAAPPGKASVAASSPAPGKGWAGGVPLPAETPSAAPAKAAASTASARPREGAAARTSDGAAEAPDAVKPTPPSLFRPTPASLDNPGQTGTAVPTLTAAAQQSGKTANVEATQVATAPPVPLRSEAGPVAPEAPVQSQVQPSPSATDPRPGEGVRAGASRSIPDRATLAPTEASPAAVEGAAEETKPTPPAASPAAQGVAGAENAARQASTRAAANLGQRAERPSETASPASAEAGRAAGRLSTPDDPPPTPHTASPWGDRSAGPATTGQDLYGSGPAVLTDRPQEAFAVRSADPLKTFAAATPRVDSTVTSEPGRAPLTRQTVQTGAEPTALDPSRPPRTAVAGAGAPDSGVEMQPSAQPGSFRTSLDASSLGEAPVFALDPAPQAPFVRFSGGIADRGQSPTGQAASLLTPVPGLSGDEGRATSGEAVLSPEDPPTSWPSPSPQAAEPLSAHASSAASTAKVSPAVSPASIGDHSTRPVSVSASPRPADAEGLAAQPGVTADASPVAASPREAASAPEQPPSTAPAAPRKNTEAPSAASEAVPTARLSKASAAETGIFPPTLADAATPVSSPSARSVMAIPEVKAEGAARSREAGLREDQSGGNAPDRVAPSPAERESPALTRDGARGEARSETNHPAPRNSGTKAAVDAPAETHSAAMTGHIREAVAGLSQKTSPEPGALPSDNLTAGRESASRPAGANGAVPTPNLGENSVRTIDMDFASETDEHLKVRLQWSNDGVRGALVTETVQSQSRLAENVGDLRRQMENAGVRVLNLDVSFAGDSRSFSNGQTGADPGGDSRSEAGQRQRSLLSTPIAPLQSEGRTTSSGVKFGASKSWIA